MNDDTDPADRCRLQAVLGRDEPCPRGRCPFWEPGGAALAGGCAVERLDLDARPDLARWLLEVRRRLETAGAEEEARDAWRDFHRRLSAGRE